MGIKGNAASGPTDDETDVSPGEDDAGAPAGLDAAVTAAMGGAETDTSADEASVGGDETTTIAGDKRDAENTDAASGDRPAARAKTSRAPKEGAEVKAIEAPRHWRAERRKVFSALPREAQDEMIKLARDLEGGFTRKSQELSDTIKWAERARSLFSDEHREQMRRAGVDELGAIKHLITLQDYATKDPLGYAKWVINNLGIDPSDLISSAPSSEGGAKTQDGAKSPEKDPVAELLRDPEVENLKAQLAAAQQQLNHVTGYIGQDYQSRQMAEQQERLRNEMRLTQTLDTFRREQDENGQLKYPHFDQVQVHMGALMDPKPWRQLTPDGRAYAVDHFGQPIWKPGTPDIVKMSDGPEKLQQAYDMAVWARPDLRSSFLEQERSRAAEAARKRAEADRAKRITQVRPATGAPTQQARKAGGGLDEALASAMAKLGA